MSSLPECCKDDQGVHGQEVWELVARGDRWRLRLRGHAWSEKLTLHVLWRKPGSLCVEVLVAPPLYASSSLLTWSPGWEQTPATSQTLVMFLFGQFRFVRATSHSGSERRSCSAETRLVRTFRLGSPLDCWNLVTCLFSVFFSVFILHLTNLLCLNINLNVCVHVGASKFNFYKKLQPARVSKVLYPHSSSGSVCMCVCVYEGVYVFVCAGHTLYFEMPLHCYLSQQRFFNRFYFPVWNFSHVTFTLQQAALLFQ